MIEQYKNSSAIDILAEEFLCYNDNEKIEALSEVQQLICEGILFSEEPFIKSPEFGGDVKSLCLHVSHACNLACEYCFAEGGDYGTGENASVENNQHKTGRQSAAPTNAQLVAKPDKNSKPNVGAALCRPKNANAKANTIQMSAETAIAAITFLAKFSGKIKNLEVDFFGGEPILNFDVVKKTVQKARELEKEYNKNFRFTLTTNAYSLDDDAIEFINKEMELVILSIDGRKKVHNSIRKTKTGGDSYDTVVANAKRLANSRGIKNYFVRGTYTSKNLDFTNDVLSLYKEGFDKISLEPVVLEDSSPLAIKEQHLQQIFSEYEKLAEEYINMRKNGDWLTFFHFNLNLYDGPCEKRLLSACGAGCSYIAVVPNGTIYPCHQFAGLKGFEIGSVVTGNYSRTIPIKFGDKNNILEKPKCQECWAKYYCGGGCVAASIKYYSDMLEPHELSCQLQKKRIECALAIWAIENVGNEE